MDAIERKRIIRQVSAQLVSLTERDVDHVLYLAQCSGSSHGFDALDREERLQDLYELFTDAADHVITRLQATLAQPGSLPRRVVDHLADLSLTEITFVLPTLADDDAYAQDFPTVSREAKALGLLAELGGDEELIATTAEMLQDELFDARPPSVDGPPDPAPESGVPLVVPAVDPDGPIFVVHGRARDIRHEVVRVLERATRREVVVLHEQANAGLTILEKFEQHAARAAYAVVLATADDRGGLADEDDLRPRGRQNVVFELGFFFSKLGRSRVAVLLEPDVEKPSDIDGLVYIPIDTAGAWKHQLTRELAAAGIAVDYARIP